jgi:hypothetical protein
VTARRDPGRAVHVYSDISLIGEQWRAGVNAHTHADRPRGQSFERRGRGPQRTRCCREHNEEGVSLRVHLNAAMAAKGFAKDSAVFSECCRISIRAPLVEELC